MAATFLRAGFEIDWEDETDRLSQHGEFLAYWKKGAAHRTYSVECRMKQPSDLGPVLSRWLSFGRLFTRALKKRIAHDATRVVCIDLNLPPAEPDVMTKRLKDAIASVDHIARLAEHTKLPPAVVVFTDLPDRHVGTDLPQAFAGALHVFKMNEYAFLGTAHDATTDASLSAIAEAMKLQATIPARFQNGNNLGSFDYTY